MASVKTYKVRRRLDMGGGAHREYGQLVPEVAAWSSGLHMVHTGEVEETEVPEWRFRAAVAEYCPELAEQLFELAGLREDATLEGTPVPSARVASMVPPVVHEHMHPAGTPVAKRAARKTPAARKRTRNKTVAPAKQAHTTITPTDVPPGTQTHQLGGPKGKE